MKYIICLLLSIGLYGFDSLKEVQKPQWVQDYEILVALDAKTSNSLLGIDSNNNGVRDDVEYFILKIYANDSFQADMFLMSAKLIQDIFKLPKDTPQKTRVKLDSDLIKLYTCRDYIVYKKEDPKIIKQELQNKLLIKRKILNNKSRLQAYIEHKNKLPFKFDTLTKEQLLKDKQNCNNIYQSYYENRDKKVVKKRTKSDTVLTNLN